MPTDWDPLLRDEFSQPYYAELTRFVEQERSAHEVHPPADLVFRALEATSWASTKVVILGQDPYHGAGQAHGLAFSVRRGVTLPPSLRNIHAELLADTGVDRGDDGDLSGWAAEGVLLLNTTLTVRDGEPGSHSGRGWETLTDGIIARVDSKPERVVFILWGAHARRKRSLVRSPHHVVLESPHPSPLSARSGFFGSRPFSRANEALGERSMTPVDWNARAAD